jgi:alpha-tubulin suppressor-like RCC1 family protein
MGSRSDWLEVSGGDLHACAIASDRSLWCWGHGDEGQLGQGEVFQNTPVPMRMGLDNDWKHVACGGHFTCAIRMDGTRWCTGTNLSGELGDNRAWRDQFTVIP